MPRKVFTAGEVLAAADVNEFLMDQAVQSFAGTAARGSAIPSPVEGMAAYLNDSNILSLYDGSAWKNSLATTGGILQVVSTTKTNTFSTTSTSFTAVTDLSVSITPSSSSSKILVLATIPFTRTSGSNVGHLRLMRDSTAIFIGDSAGNRIRSSVGVEQSSLDSNTTTLNFLDSPSTTSAIAYSIEVRSNDAITSVYVNRNSDDGDNTTNARYASSIILMEVAG
jgi:hypothetical protein